MTRLVYVVLGCLLLTGCNDWLLHDIPSAARPPTDAELVAVYDVVDRFEDRLPLSDKCHAYTSRAMVMDASGLEIMDHCRACPPSEDGTPCDAAKFGRVAACLVSYESTPIAVVWEGYSEDVAVSAVHHEVTHAIGLCERVYGSYGHQSTVLWGPDGVHPL